MTYSQVIKYLNSFINYEKKSNYSYLYAFKLERMKILLETMGSPQKELNVIHIAGSKGKGSVCSFIAYILKEAGFKVGLYTSPHLNNFRERIRVLKQMKEDGRRTTEFEGMISEQEVCDLVKELKPTIDKFNKNYKYGALTFFEVYTAFAFKYFRDKKVDFVVLETGLGGRLDATNTCNSLVSVITPLSLEHTYLLGKTLKKIAFEKAAIIKSENRISTIGKRLVVSAKQDKEAIAVIEKIAQRNNVLLFEENRDFKFVMKDDSFDYGGINYKIDNLKIKLKGRHQIQNACLAIASIEALGYHNMEPSEFACRGDIRRSHGSILRRRRINIGKNAIRSGLRSCFWPARFEIVSKNPLIIIDGAHNSASMVVLRKTLREFSPHKKVWAIFGISQDKELKDTCREVPKISKNIILTKADNPRAAEPQDLLRYFSNNSILLTHSTREALNLAKTKIKKDDLILATGSLYICGEVREIIGDGQN